MTRLKIKYESFSMFKCDRCYIEFRESEAATITDLYFLLASEFGGPCHDGDLCPECTKEFLEWFSAYEDKPARKSA